MLSFLLLPLLWSLSFAQNSTNTNITTQVTGSGSTLSTVLVIARDAASASSASEGLNGYGIPFTTLLVPQGGVALPALDSSGVGNFGGIVVASAVSYDYGASGFQSALTADQWNQLYTYQLTFGVRMVQFDVYPGPLYGATALGGCCNTGVEQLVSVTSAFTSAVPQAGMKSGAGVSTQGLWHYPASITNTSSTIEIAQFAAGGSFANPSTAGVINNFDGRQQMAFFIGWATDWSATSNYLQHAWVTWMTRGLYAGFRRVILNTQVDDLFLETDMYSPNGTTFRVRPGDLSAHVSWTPQINAKMNSGSNYFMELGLNGNGNIESSEDTANGERTCTPGAIEYPDQIDTPLEFQKPLGTGTNQWPNTPTSYVWTAACQVIDPLEQWFATPANLNAFAYITHTFTHLELNNATYSDALKEIQFNQAWFSRTGIGQASRFTSDGLIPPAITGLHNGDALRAWYDAGLRHCVGDNTRPPLLNPTNKMWPLITNVANNGYDGYEVIPRWATRIYYNCDLPDCTVKEWIATSAGSGDYSNLLATELADTTRHLFGLYHDAYMFHQVGFPCLRVIS